MSRGMPGHRFAAIVVLIVAGAWVLTGKFSSVGSEQAKAAEKPQTVAAEQGPTTFRPTVAAMAPVFEDHARAIRISGATEADKTVTLAARASGVISALNVKQGEKIAGGAAVMTLDGPDVLAAVTNAKAVLAQRAHELDVDEKLAKTGNLADLTLLAARTAKAAAESAVAQAEAAADRLT
ncbi:MAG: biotin/lipoyl-binding protein, partial [Paracoccaceae bacterium]|nr:biotin/lipoyl-binding protein [Paracoccaceae bacterium]